ncbi:MAG: NAD(P)-dependent oxidoreductase [Sediminibacterium sp.]
MTKKIGLVGLGIMGKPMAMNLLKAGYALYVFDVNENALEAVKAQGAIVCGSPKELAGQTEIIITILPDSPQVKEVALGHNGLLEGISAGKLLIDMSTIDAATEAAIHEQFRAIGADTLDAPVSGGQVGAEQGSLSIMVGGERESFELALPVFQAIGKKISYMGKIGAGQITKSCSQIATALTTQGVIEAFALAESAGIDMAKVRDALSGGFAESRVLLITGDKIVRKDFAPGFKLKLYSKDLRIAKSAAAERSLSLPGTQLLSAEMDALVAAGKGELDFSALFGALNHSLKD